jgi:hypothetical protein
VRKGLREGAQEKTPSKEHWLGGLGLDVSPIKMRSAWRKKVDNKGGNGYKTTTLMIKGLLEDSKPKPDPNHDTPHTKYKGSWRAS